MRKFAPWIALAGLAISLPFAGQYLHFLLATILIFTLVAMSLTILIGFAGQISIGHAAFWALGAYTTAILTTKLGVPFGVGVLAGGMVAAVLGALLALPALRVQGHYLAIATLGFALFVQQVLQPTGLLHNCRQERFRLLVELKPQSQPIFLRD